MRILVGCEESGIVRDAFEALGHDAWSNDILPARNGGQHLQIDVMDAILNHGPWDIIILHPPCTALAVSGNSTYGTNMPKNKERHAAKDWTVTLWYNAINTAKVGVCLENPVGVLHDVLGKPTQYVQPYMFGHTEQKKTGLWLHNLPKLVATDNVYEEMMKLPKNKRERLHYLPPSPDRAKLRSTTYSGIAAAMAAQWSIV
jgi:hypothetical protein